MPQTLIPPVSLDEYSFEQMIAQLGQLTRDAGTINVDLGRLEFVDPYGMTGILLLGHHLTQQGRKLLLHLPLSMEVQRCLDQMGFFRYLTEFYRMYPPYRPPAARASLAGRQVDRHGLSEAILEITRIAQGDNVTAMVRKIEKQAGSIFETCPRDEDWWRGFLGVLSEISHNIIQHSGNTGFVGIQRCSDETRQGKNVVRIAAMDLGIGFRKSLELRCGLQYGENWSDLVALEEALLHDTLRDPTTDREHGLSAAKYFVQRWGGMLSVRSGTAKLSLFPDRERGRERETCRRDRETGLSEFPGVQISLTLPEM